MLHACVVCAQHATRSCVRTARDSHSHFDCPYCHTAHVHATRKREYAETHARVRTTCTRPHLITQLNTHTRTRAGSHIHTYNRHHSGAHRAAAASCGRYCGTVQGINVLVAVMLAHERRPPTVAAGVPHAEFAAKLGSLPSLFLDMVFEAIMKLKVRLALACVRV
jgi:hypothetical protein